MQVWTTGTPGLPRLIFKFSEQFSLRVQVCFYTGFIHLIFIELLRLYNLKKKLDEDHRKMIFQDYVVLKVSFSYFARWIGFK